MEVLEMKISGCKPGQILLNNQCQLPRIPRVGHGLIPSVEDAAGCKMVKGHWIPGNDICVYQDLLGGGYTAPYKGAFVAWNVDSTMGEDADTMVGELIFCHPQVESKLGYEGCLPFKQLRYTPWEYYERLDENLDWMTFAWDNRNEAMFAAQTLKAGEAEFYELDYYDENGFIVPPNSDRAIIASNPQNARNVMALYKKHSKEPFKVRKGPL
jgi:hypothetical protein